MAETVLVEILSADPIGPLSLSQGRTAVQGDVVANLFAFFGDTVRREYYVNDMGPRAAHLCDAVRRCILSNAEGETVDARFDPHVRVLADQLLAASGDALINAGNDEWDRFCSSLPAFLLEQQRRTLANLGVTYSNWFDEKEISPEAVQVVLQGLRDSGLVREQGGALWLDSRSGGRTLLRRDNGSYTYFAVDLAYHLSKAERGATRLLDVWGPAYHRHRDRIREAMEALGLGIPLEILVTGGVRLENDGVPVVYIDAATTPLDPLLDHGSAVGLRYLLNAAPPEEELVLEVDDLNSPRLPPALKVVLRAEEALRHHLGDHPAGVNDSATLRTALEGFGQAVEGSDRLSLLSRRTEEVLKSALARRRPDLLNAHLDALSRELGETDSASLLQRPGSVLQGIHAALGAALYVMRMGA